MVGELKTQEESMAAERPRRALVVGGTSGIGRAIANRLAQEKFSITVMGRSRGDDVVRQLTETYPEGAHEFIATDASLLTSVKRSCDEFKAKHDSLDVLVTCQGGAPNLAGRVETTEGLDQKMVLHYFGRVMFWQQLAGLLDKTPTPRVLSVHGQAGEYKQYKDDFELKKNYSASQCNSACGTYNSLALDAFAREHPTAYTIHAFPGIVNTNWGREWSAPLRLTVRFTQMLISVSPETCAEYLCRPLLLSGNKTGFSVVGAKAQEVPKFKVHTDEAREFVWAQTKAVLQARGE
jgi:NAD(P)-dependent dehydrogenase (short-subunit alcohol dehydrogenase family)